MLLFGFLAHSLGLLRVLVNHPRYLGRLYLAYTLGHLIFVPYIGFATHYLFFTKRVFILAQRIIHRAVIVRILLGLPYKGLAIGLHCVQLISTRFRCRMS